MSDFRRLLGTVWASPQIDAEDIAEAAEQGFTLVINNRPDHEESSQPEGASIEAAVRAAGGALLALPAVLDVMVDTIGTESQPAQKGLTGVTLLAE